MSSKRRKFITGIFFSYTIMGANETVSIMLFSLHFILDLEVPGTGS